MALQDSHAIMQPLAGPTNLRRAGQVLVTPARMKTDKCHERIRELKQSFEPFNTTSLGFIISVSH